ncbi:MAG: pentapeptide repeat-containing protein [Solirubrobacterales bacterium]
MNQVRKHITFANVMSSLAVFLVIAGGTAFAAGQLAKNSVGTKQLKKNAVTAAKIKTGAVTGAKINEASLGQVPSAATAGSAASAGIAANANAVNGQSVVKVFKLLPQSSAPQTLASFAGFSIVSVCNGGEVKSLELVPPLNVDIEMKVSSGGEFSGLHAESVQGINERLDLKGANFRGNASFSGATIGGAVFSGNLGFDDTISFDNTDACAYYGHVIVSG